MTNVAKLSLLSLLLFLSTPGLAASRPSDAILDQYYSAANRTIEIIVAAMRPHLSDEERHMLDKIDIYVSKKDWNIYGVHASRYGRRREIVFPIGFIIALDPLDQAIAVGHVTGRGFDDVMPYLSMYVQTLYKNIARERRGETIEDIPSFGRFTGMSEDEYEQIINSEEFETLRDQLKLHAFAMILGHELGHHFEGHLDNRYSSLEEELEADAVGVRLSLASDYNPVAGFVPFLFYAAMKNDTGIYQGRADHPPPLCRAATMVELGAQELEKDPQFIRYMMDTNQLQSWRQNNVALREIMLKETKCPSDGSAQVSKPSRDSKSNAFSASSPFCNDLTNVLREASSSFRRIKGTYDRDFDEHTSRMIVTDATQCYISSDEYDHTFSCSWDFGENAQASARFFEATATDIRQCLNARIDSERHHTSNGTDFSRFALKDEVTTVRLTNGSRESRRRGEVHTARLYVERER